MKKLLASALHRIRARGQKAEQQVSCEHTTEVPKTPEEEAADAVWHRRGDVLYKSWVQLRYHKKRQMFFDRIDKSTKAFTLLLGATLMGSDIKSYLPYVASAISFMSLLSLVFTYGERKQTHKELAEKYGQLTADIEKVPPLSATAVDVAKWTSECVSHAAKAPPPLKRLTLYCEREQCIAQGHEPQKAQGLWANFFFLGKNFF